MSRLPAIALHRTTRSLRAASKLLARASIRETDGLVSHDAQDLAQLAFMRPTPDLAGYATPVRGLYLCGAGTHRGGGVIGASGHNAAMRVLADRRRAALRRRAGSLRRRLT
jgi:phytoene dehydrogenase-like protein